MSFQSKNENIEIKKPTKKNYFVRKSIAVGTRE